MKEHLKKMAALSAQKNVPSGYVYVGSGSKSLSELFKRGDMIMYGCGRFGEKPHWMVNYICIGDSAGFEYAVKKDAFEKVCGTPVTLVEIKEKLEKAKELIGKKVTVGGKSKLGKCQSFTVERVRLILDVNDSFFPTTNREAFDADGYCISLDGLAFSVAYEYHEVCDSVLVVFSGPKVAYTAEILKDKVILNGMELLHEHIFKLAKEVGKFQKR